MKPLAFAPVAVCLSFATASPSQAQLPLQDGLRAHLERQLETIAGHLDGVAGYIVLDAASGERLAGRLADEPFPTASTIKIPILFELLKQADEGRLSLERSAPLERSQVVGGSGVLQYLTAPALSLADHAALMMIVSDNTATNVVIDAVGLPAVGTRMQSLGLADVQLRRKMMDGEAARRGDENVASPASLARATLMLWKGEGLTEQGRETARRMLRPVSGAIRASIPSGVPVYSKTGGLDGVRAETAVVDLEGRPFVLTVMTTYLKDAAAGSAAIGQIAAAVYNHMERLAASGPTGRRLP